MRVNRREFLRKSICAALGGASLYSALGSLRLIGAAAAAQRPSGGFTDYKALVCVFLYGGNDSFNTVVPMSGQDQVNYLASRGDLALTAGLQALTPASGGGPSNYGLHPAMPELAGLFNTGKAAIVANVGSLLYPITQAQYQDGTRADALAALLARRSDQPVADLAPRRSERERLGRSHRRSAVCV